MHILALILTLLFFSPPLAKPDCREVERITGGVEVEWLGYEQGGWDLPADIDRTAYIDFADGGLWEYRAKSQRGTRWLFWFGSYEQTADANGQHFGAHEFCLVVITD